MQNSIDVWSQFERCLQFGMTVIQFCVEFERSYTKTQSHLNASMPSVRTFLQWPFTLEFKALSLCPVTMDRNFYVACLVWSEIGPRSNNIVGPSQGMFLSKFYRLPEWPIFGIFAVYIALQPLGTRLIIKTWYSIGNHRSFDTLRLLLVGHSFAFAWNGN